LSTLEIIIDGTVVKKILFIQLILFSVYFIGCEKGDPLVSNLPLPPPPDFSGNWVSTNSVVLLFDLALVDSRGLISGRGVLNNSLLFSVTGNNDYPNVSIKISTPGFAPAYYSGVFIHPDTIAGVFNSSGFYDTQIVLARY
jgi:hypothetical protein